MARVDQDLSKRSPDKLIENRGNDAGQAHAQQEYKVGGDQWLRLSVHP
jgi:hypothetical protein